MKKLLHTNLLFHFFSRIFWLSGGMAASILLISCSNVKTKVPIQIYDFPTDRSVTISRNAPHKPQSKTQRKAPAIQKPKLQKTPPQSKKLQNITVYSWPKVQRLLPSATNRALIIHDLGKAAKLSEKPKATAQPNTQKQDDLQTKKPKTRDKAPTATSKHNNLLFSWPSHGNLLRKHSQSGTKGIELGGKVGDPVFAAADGQVTYTGTGLRGYGKLIVIKHMKGFLSVYAHNSRILVKEGQRVKRGQKVAEVGETEAKRPKLLFQLRQGKRSLNPQKYLPKK